LLPVFANYFSKKYPKSEMCNNISTLAMLKNILLQAIRAFKPLFSKQYVMIQKDRQIIQAI